MRSHLRYTGYVERYAVMFIGNDLLRAALDMAKDAYKAGDMEKAQRWMTTAAGITVLMEDEQLPIRLYPKPRE